MKQIARIWNQSITRYKQEERTKLYFLHAVCNAQIFELRKKIKWAELKQSEKGSVEADVTCLPVRLMESGEEVHMVKLFDNAQYRIISSLCYT